MKNADRIVTERHISAKWRLPPMGWLAVYTLALLFFGGLVYMVF